MCTWAKTNMINSLCSVAVRMFQTSVSLCICVNSTCITGTFICSYDMLIFKPKGEAAICDRKKKNRKQIKKTWHRMEGNPWSCNRAGQEEGNTVSLRRNVSAFRLLAVSLGIWLLTGKPIGLLITVAWIWPAQRVCIQEERWGSTRCTGFCLNFLNLFFDSVALYWILL